MSMEDRISPEVRFNPYLVRTRKTEQKDDRSNQRKEKPGVRWIAKSDAADYRQLPYLHVLD
jgi:hypothetical protein